MHAEQDFSVTLADTGIDCMTGGRIRKIERYVDDDIFLMTYGDGLTDVNIRDLVEFHKSHGKIATVTTVAADLALRHARPGRERPRRQRSTKSRRPTAG